MGGESKTAEKFGRELARSKAGECVRVVVRVRPLNSTEKQEGYEAAAIVDEQRASISLTNPSAAASEPPKVFTFDQVYGPTAQQKQIYDRTAAAIVESVCEGYNGTIFAYGQTGAGKTHTMEGCRDPPELKGIIPNSFKHIFDKIAAEGSDHKQFLVRASYLEIYMEECRDLLAHNPKNKLELKESVDSGVYVKDQRVEIVKSVAEIDRLMQEGNGKRKVGATRMNQTSSRSHSIFSIVVETSELDESSGEAKIRVGKLNLVDLAGSERQSKTGATGERLEEATKINLSLSALGNVISALVGSKSQHIPYRDSKLTRLLQDSLGGNTKTVMIANCGPADYNYDETLSTLRYADRAKKIKNKPKINEDPKDAMLREFQEEIMRLKAQLQAAANGQPIDPNSVVDGVAAVAGKPVMDSRQIEELKEEMKSEMKRQAEEDKRRIQQQAQEQLEKITEEKRMSEKERADLKARLEREGQQALRAKQAKEALQKKLKMMEQRLLVGGMIMDKAAKQEEDLRKAEIELEERRVQERILARKVIEKEEEMMLKEERYSSLQDEVEVKTKKLKKLWQKYQGCKTEVKDLEQSFQQEREDMLHTIRELTRQVKLKELVIEHFIPTDEADKLNARAQWDEKQDQWKISRIEFAGNQLRPTRPLSNMRSRRPETDYANHRKQYDDNPRYRSENVATLDLEMTERLTADYDGAAMNQRVQAALTAALESGEPDVSFGAAPENLPTCNPYLSYNPGDPGTAGSESVRERGSTASSSRRTKSRGASSKRPGTASRAGRDRRKSSSASRDDGPTMSLMSHHHRHAHHGIDDDEGKDPEEMYPSARGLVSRS
ncbi:Kinesin-like protein KIF3B [Hondaea fermentalgiana]|uniref:Kinesin-like protein n=1 Tax=Hondaea fermentalgiana TaxID=2315210 RepID=A0A2R5GCR8_9STRA|nr:Kinesin-like protein KIF3B [Hondaea fermentalgiana]|eukprot:GBG25574.1 Kinesin-like protein KIF3B [Hondaea fermentalgiana]